MQVCPICGTEYADLHCTCCGYDESQDFERYATLQPVPEGTASIAGWKAEYEASLSQNADDLEELLPEASEDESCTGWKWLIFVAGLFLIVGFVG